MGKGKRILIDHTLQRARSEMILIFLMSGDSSNTRRRNFCLMPMLGGHHDCNRLRLPEHERKLLQSLHHSLRSELVALFLRALCFIVPLFDVVVVELYQSPFDE